MNPQEVNHIRECKKDLITNTRITLPLLYELQISNFLSSNDIQYMMREGINDRERARIFYDLAVTKTGLYNPLIKALTRQNQNGAAKILMELPAEPVDENEPVNIAPQPQQDALMDSDTEGEEFLR